MVKIAVASSRGISHEITGNVCQDAVGKCNKDGCFVAVVCDGAGSVENSELASTFVSNFLPNYLCENFTRLRNYDENFISKIVYTILKSHAIKEKLELDCTLLAVVGNGTDKDLILHIGDGVIFGENSNSELEIVSFPENGKESYYTYFLSDNDALEHLRVYKTDCCSYLLSTDGISSLLFNNSRVKPAAKIMIDWLKQSDEETVEDKMKEEFERMFKQYTQDDIGVAIISK